jgi:polar amino acid transport system substrate-binding protein
MALTICLECKQKISDQAHTCSHCGAAIGPHPVVSATGSQPRRKPGAPKTKVNPAIGRIGVLALLAVFGGALAWLPVTSWQVGAASAAVAPAPAATASMPAAIGRAGGQSGFEAQPYGGLVLTAGTPSPAATGPVPPQSGPAQPDTTLRVATILSEPFVIKQGDAWSGFSVELWDKIAQQRGWQYQWVEVETVQDQIDAVQTGAADAAMAEISITPERELLVDFSHPYFNSGLQIMVPAAGDQTIFATLGGLFPPALLQLLGIGLLVSFLMANIIWLVQRKINPGFPKPYLAGVFEGLWYTVGSMSGNFVDERPAGILRKVVQMMWVIIGIILIAQFTASITSSLTVQALNTTIDSPDDLPGKHVATVRSTTAADYLAEHHVDFKEVDRIDDAYDQLARRRVQAVVYDAPALLYYAAREGKGRVKIAGPMFKEETYGIALPLGSPLRKDINEALLKLKQDGTYDALRKKWFSPTD